MGNIHWSTYYLLFYGIGAFNNLMLNGFSALRSRVTIKAARLD